PVVDILVKQPAALATPAHQCNRVDVEQQRGGAALLIRLRIHNVRAPEGQIKAVRARRILRQQITEIGRRLVSGGNCQQHRYNLGSTGSLSSASTANTHSCTRRSGSPRAKRSNPSSPSANSRSASERLALRKRWRSRSRLAGAV